MEIPQIVIERARLALKSLKVEAERYIEGIVSDETELALAKAELKRKTFEMQAEIDLREFNLLQTREARDTVFNQIDELNIFLKEVERNANQL